MSGINKTMEKSSGKVKIHFCWVELSSQPLPHETDPQGQKIKVSSILIINRHFYKIYSKKIELRCLFAFLRADPISNLIAKSLEFKPKHQSVASKLGYLGGLCNVVK